MHQRWPASLVTFAVAAVIAAFWQQQPAKGGDFSWLARGFSWAMHHEPLQEACDPAMDETTEQIDRLVRFLDRYGSIVAKQPDVWGQNRLTRHRQEYEELLRAELVGFEVRANAAIRRSDQAFLGMAMALQAATDRRPGPDVVPVPSTTSTTNVLNQVGSLLPDPNAGTSRDGEGVITRTAPFGMPAAYPGMQFEAAPISLEPTLRLDQLSRYLNHLHELRRINEGDDIADSPGYSLNLVRIPVSVEPGQQTKKGHGAKLTATARLVLGDELLPTTFRSLVLNDLVDVIAPALTWCVNDHDCVRWAATIVRPLRDPAPESRMLIEPSKGPTEPDRGLMMMDGRVAAAVRSLAARLPTITASTAPSVKSRRARMPIPFSQLADAAGTREIAILIHDTQAALANHPSSRPCIPYGEVRSLVAEELEAAYDFLTQQPQRAVWIELAGWNLAEAVRSRRVDEITRIREEYFLRTADARQTTTAVLGWAILIESCLLDARLADDIRDAAIAHGCGETLLWQGPFYGPEPSPEARLAFNEYVCRRWPLKVFALDPVVQEQNVEDAFARRRELQIAAAMAFASGRMNAQALTRFTRRLEMEMTTIALERTAVGFAHGNDTFGWMFMPRVQTPPEKSTLVSFTETLCGGPSTEAELAQRRLEPGMRECTAIVVMPSFVPAVAFDVESHWFSLAHPAHVKPSTKETMLFSRSLKAIEARMLHCQHNAHLYRPHDLGLLAGKLHQIDRRLPTQALEARIPFENTSGGFELFTAGITDLAPELIGWYGAPGINPGSTTSLYLIGKGFSVHDTSVIAGGRKVPIALVSREVLRADIPPGVLSLPAAHQGRQPTAAEAALSLAAHDVADPRTASPVEELPSPVPGPSGGAEVWLEPPQACDACETVCNDREVVEIHLATPYGVSSRLFVPVARRETVGGGMPAFAEPYRLGLTFTTTKGSDTQPPAAKVNEFYSFESDEIVIRTPAYFIPPSKAQLVCTLTDEASAAIAATFGTSELVFDARLGGYRLAGNELRNFIGDTSRPATDKTLRGAVKPYLDSLLAAGRFVSDGDAVTLRLSATLVAEQQQVPVDGGMSVVVTRRGTSVADAPTADEP